MAFIQMGQLRLAPRKHGILCDQKRNGSPLRLIILTCDIQDRRSDHVCQSRKNIGQTFCIVLFIYISNIVFLFSCRLGITDVINVKAQGFGQVVKPVQFQFLPHGFLQFVKICNDPEPGRVSVKSVKPA